MDIESMKKKIIEMVDDSSEDGRKIAFYSNPTVQEILDSLYARWENHGRKGIPLDYATEEEVKILYTIAVKATNVPASKSYINFIRSKLFGKS